MTAKKYQKYVTTECSRPDPHGKIQMSTRHLGDFGGRDFSIDCSFITKPQVMIEKAHKHAFNQYLCFFGSGHYDITDFDAEIEYSLGEEHEKYIITQPTVVYVPAGLAHGPLKFVRITKPVLFVDVAQTDNYTRSWEED